MSQAALAKAAGGTRGRSSDGKVTIIREVPWPAGGGGPGPGPARTSRNSPAANGHRVSALAADTAYGEDANTGYAGNGPQAMAALRISPSACSISTASLRSPTLQAISRDRNRILDYLPL